MEDVMNLGLSRRKLDLAERTLAKYQPKTATKAQRARAIDSLDALNQFTTDQIAACVGCSASTVTRRRSARK